MATQKSLDEQLKGPKIIQLEFGRVFSVGEFESERYVVHIELSEKQVMFSDQIRNVNTALRKQVQDLYIQGLNQRKDELEGRLQAEKELGIQPSTPRIITRSPEAKQTTQPLEPKATPAWIGQELRNHRWNAKKIEGEDSMYTEGNLSWGWDWPREFSNELIDWLKKNSVILEDEKHVYEIILDQNMVKTKSIATK